MNRRTFELIQGGASETSLVAEFRKREKEFMSFHGSILEYLQCFQAMVRGMELYGKRDRFDQGAENLLARKRQVSQDHTAVHARLLALVGNHDVKGGAAKPQEIEALWLDYIGRLKDITQREINLVFQKKKAGVTEDWFLEYEGQVRIAMSVLNSMGYSPNQNSVDKLQVVAEEIAAIMRRARIQETKRQPSS